MTTTPRTARRLSRPGLSMVEVILSIAIVGGLLAAVLNAAGLSAKRSLSTMRQSQANWLAHDLLAEVAAQPCRADNPGLLTGLVVDITDIVTNAGGSRAAFNDVFDYNGWGSTPPVTRNGTPIAGFERWTRSATVRPVHPLTLATRAGTDTAAVITVTVVSPEGFRRSVSILRTAGTDTFRDGQTDGDAANDGLIDGLLKGLLG